MNARDLARLAGLLARADEIVEQVRSAVAPQARLGARRGADDDWYQLLCHLRTNAPARAHIAAMIAKEERDGRQGKR